MLMMWAPEQYRHHPHDYQDVTRNSLSVSHSSAYNCSDNSSCDELLVSSAVMPDDWQQHSDHEMEWHRQKSASRMSGSRNRLDTEELCLICGDRASGYHYNALSCEGCKGFFRRSITRNAQYVCKYSGSCEMDMWMRRKCQACRLLRCHTVGMKEECLLSERQCVARNARRQETHKVKRRPHRLSVVSAEGHRVTAVDTSNTTTNTSSTAVSQSPPLCRSPLQLLSEEHNDLIALLVTYQDKYEMPSDEDIRKVAELNIASSLQLSCEADAAFGHMVEMAIVVTRLVVEFAKRMPGFQTIGRDDQIALLKAASSEVMVLRASRRYDPETDCVVMSSGTPFSLSSMSFAHCGLMDFVEAMFHFARGMASLGVDNAEYALLVSLCIFSDRRSVKDTRAVGRIQEVYTEALIEYVKLRRVDSSRFLAKLLMKLVDLRTVNCLHTDCLYKLTIAKGSLPPLLQEYFDIPHVD